MWVEWTNHLNDPQDKENFQSQVFGAKTVLNRIKEIIENKEKALDRSELSMDTYSLPNWEHRQAHKNGNRESLKFLKTLVDLDSQREAKASQKLPENK
jgi:hypothetical protein